MLTLARVLTTLLGVLGSGNFIKRFTGVGDPLSFVASSHSGLLWNSGARVVDLLKLTRHESPFESARTAASRASLSVEPVPVPTYTSLSVNRAKLSVAVAVQDEVARMQHTENPRCPDLIALYDCDLILLNVEKK